MISSILLQNNDIVSLVPVQKMTAHDLYTITLEEIKHVVTTGSRMMTIISDNNIINRKMFIEFSGSDSLMPYIVNPVNRIDRIVILFDTVHLLTCVRNNGINEAEKTFVYQTFIITHP